MIAAMDPKVRDTCEFVPQAIIARPPAYFAARGISFRTGLDDLNTFHVAELALDDVPFALMRHEGTPIDETEVHLPDTIPPGRVPSIIDRILKELDLTTAAVQWQRDRVDTPY
jgi:hypothetical protein